MQKFRDRKSEKHLEIWKDFFQIMLIILIIYRIIKRDWKLEITYSKRILFMFTTRWWYWKQCKTPSLFEQRLFKRNFSFRHGACRCSSISTFFIYNFCIKLNIKGDKICPFEFPLLNQSRLNLIEDVKNKFDKVQRHGDCLSGEFWFIY